MLHDSTIPMAHDPPFPQHEKGDLPHEDYRWSWVKIMTKAEWTKLLDDTSKRPIHWYSHWNESEDTIIRCGGFPNVPMKGTQGAINYNPKLAL
ncbi:hypothetical protein CR513_31008, partial [Mucuna pruriens]